MKKHLYLMPVLALSLASFALAGCDDKKETDGVAETTTSESSIPTAVEPALDTTATTDTTTAPVVDAPVVSTATTQSASVTEAMSYATAEGATTGAVFANLHNMNTKPDMLTGATTDVAGSVEIHENYTDPQTNTVEMRKTSGVEIPANGAAKLEPTGYHIMLLDLKKPLVVGESFDLALTFRDGGTVTVPVIITAPGTTFAPAASILPDASTAIVSPEIPSSSGNTPEAGSAPVTETAPATTPSNDTTAE